MSKKPKRKTETAEQKARRLMRAIYTEPVYIDEADLKAARENPITKSPAFAQIHQVVADLRARLGIDPPD